MKKLQIEKELYNLYCKCKAKQFNYYKSMCKSYDKYQEFKKLLSQEQDKLFEDYILAETIYEDERCFEYGKFVLEIIKSIFR